MHAVVANRSLLVPDTASKLRRELHFTIYIHNMWNPLQLLFKYIQLKSANETIQYARSLYQQ